MAWGGFAVAVVVTVVMVRRRTFGSVLTAAVVVAVVMNGAMYGRRGQGAATGWRLRVVVIMMLAGWSGPWAVQTLCAKGCCSVK